MRSERFDDIFNLLFFDEHALLKDFRFSDVWAAKFAEWQRRLTKERGYQGGAITQVIRTFTWAPQRFESFYIPLFNLLCIIPAVIWMLKTIAEDWRCDKSSKRALRALDAIDAQFILDLGIMSDYGCICLRLIRRFDVHSKDPSLTRSIIRAWERQMSSLFRECNIFRQASPLAPGLEHAQASEEPGPQEEESMRKTGTQIAMEQIDYIREVDYANRVRDFKAIPPRQLFETGIQKMKQVVDAASARVAADFTDATDFYMCLEIFNLDVWLPFLTLASSQSIPRSEGAGLRLARKFRLYLDHFATEYQTLDDWIIVVAIAVRHRNLLLSEQPQRSPEYHLDHRICWALSLAEIEQNHRWASRLVLGYLTWIDGTGSVERGLGIHTGVLACHSGSRARKLGEDAIEMIAEIRLDGLANSAEIQYKDRSGAVHAGEFALECAALWLATRGRRFGCYKKRCDAGTTRQYKHKSQIGTYKMQRTLQTQALDSIATGGTNSWLPGASQTELKRKCMSTPADKRKEMVDFNDTTKKRRVEKTEAGVWRGFSVKPSEPRRVASSIQSLASSQTQASSSSDSNATTKVQPLVAIDESVGADTRRRYKDMTAGALQTGTAFLVESVRDLDLGNISPTKALVWLHVIAMGKSVVAEESKQTRAFLRAVGMVAAKLHFTKFFRTKNEPFFKTFMSLLQREAKSCKWRSIAAPEKGAWIINGLEDIRRFLLNVQRVPSGSLSFSRIEKQRPNPPRTIGSSLRRPSLLQLRRGPVGVAQAPASSR